MKVNLEKECLEELGRIFKDIAKSNDDVIKTIASRKDNKIITGYSFDIKCTTKSEPWLFKSTPFTSNVSMRLRNWRYNGEKLEEPEDIFNDKIDYTLESWEDVKRLNRELHKVGCKFSDRLADKIQNRRDMVKFLNNITKISNVLKDIIKMTEDVADPLAKHEAAIFETLQEKLKGIDFSLDAKLLVGDTIDDPLAKHEEAVFEELKEDLKCVDLSSDAKLLIGQTIECTDNKINFNNLKDWDWKERDLITCKSNRAYYNNEIPTVFFGFKHEPYVAIAFEEDRMEDGFYEYGFEVWNLLDNNNSRYECIHPCMHSIVASRKNGEDILISGSYDRVCFWRIGETSSFDMITPKADRFIYCLACGCA